MHHELLYLGEGEKNSDRKNVRRRRERRRVDSCGIIGREKGIKSPHIPLPS